MADTRLHSMTADRSLVERFFWLWLILAFLVGLLPGLGLWWYQRTTANARAERLLERVTLDKTKLDARDKQLAKLTSEVASAQAALVSGTGTAPSGGSTSGGTGTAPVDTSPPPAGTVRFVSRTLTPSPASVGGPLSAAIVIAGDATDAYIELKNQSGTYSKIWRLKAGPKSGATRTWTRDDATAPKAAADYTVFTWAFVGPKRFVMKPSGSLTVK
jgi:hypothetical protein